MNVNLTKQFYTGGLNQFGFGTFNSGEVYIKKSNIPETTYIPKNNDYNTNNINNQNNIPEGPNNMNQSNYNKDFNPFVSQPYNPYSNNYPSRINSNYFTPEILKMQEIENQLNKLNSNYPNKDSYKQRNFSNNDIYQNRAYPKSAIKRNNLNNDYPFDIEQMMNQIGRRNQIQRELMRARQIVHRNDNDSESETETVTESESTNNYNENKSKSKPNTLLQAGNAVLKRNKPTPGRYDNKSIESFKKTNDNITNNKGSIMNAPKKTASIKRRKYETTTVSEKKKGFNRREEVEKEKIELMQNIPHHIALQLQAQGFKARENMYLLKADIEDVVNGVENKLEDIDMNQKINFEKIKKIIEEKGNNNIKQSMRNNYSNDTYTAQIPDYMKNIRQLLNERLNINELKNKYQNGNKNEQNKADNNYCICNNTAINENKGNMPDTINDLSEQMRREYADKLA